MKSQKITTAKKPIVFNGKNYFIQATIRFDDECKNGKNSFAITANITTRSGITIACGCLHDEIAQTFPELKHAIKWHLWDTCGALHHVANGLYWYKEKGIEALREYVNCPTLTEEEATESGLLKRLPEQLKEFKECVESLGMVYTETPIC